MSFWAAVAHALNNPGAYVTRAAYVDPETGRPRMVLHAPLDTADVVSTSLDGAEVMTFGSWVAATDEQQATDWIVWEGTP